MTKRISSQLGILARGYSTRCNSQLRHRTIQNFVRQNVSFESRHYSNGKSKSFQSDAEDKDKQTTANIQKYAAAILKTRMILWNVCLALN